MLDGWMRRGCAGNGVGGREEREEQLEGGAMGTEWVNRARQA